MNPERCSPVEQDPRETPGEGSSSTAPPNSKLRGLYFATTVHQMLYLTSYFSSSCLVFKQNLSLEILVSCSQTNHQLESCPWPLYSPHFWGAFPFGNSLTWWIIELLDAPNLMRSRVWLGKNFIKNSKIHVDEQGMNRGSCSGLLKVCASSMSLEIIVAAKKKVGGGRRILI